MINGADFLKWLQVFGVKYGGGSGGAVTEQQVQQSAFNFEPAAGVDDAFTITLNPPVVALTPGLLVTMYSGSLQNNTSSPTLKINALSPVAIQTFVGAPAPGDIQQHSMYLFIYNANINAFQLINPSITTADTFEIQQNGYNYALDGGVTNAYIANILPFNNNLIGGLYVVLRTAHANTGASTLTVNGSTANIVNADGTALTGGEIQDNGLSVLLYSDTFSAFALQDSLFPSLVGAKAGNIEITANTISSTNTDGDINLTPDGAGQVNVPLIPINASSAASKQYVDSAGSAWTGISGTAQAAVIDNGYVVQNSGQTTVTLPATAPLGARVAIAGLGAGGWILAANTGQNIQVGALSTSTAGSLTSYNQYDQIEVICIVQDTTWSARFVYSSGLTIS